ncbi:MAG: phage portal protein [Eubacteriales bacterium]|nr:phage portal protein [Eubacteriales bacterium]
MNWLDDAIGFLSPEWGYRRQKWREALRNYDAGNNERLNANWRVINQSAENTDRYSRDTVRARARDLERNSDMMNGVAGAFRRNVIGAGFELRADTDAPDINEKIQELWKKWCKKKNCDVTETQGLNDILRMLVQRKKIDGGILIVKRYSKTGIIPFKLQILEVDELDSMQIAPLHKGNRVVGGVEYNSWNKAERYYIRQYDVDGFGIGKPYCLEAEDVIFFFEKRRPSQLREMSDMTPTITRIRDTNEFMTAVSVKERIMACLSIFIKRAFPTVNGLPGRNSTERRISYEGKTLSPGMIKELNQGDDVEVVNPNGQATDATDYIKLNERLIASGQGLSYESVSRDMSQSTYSSARQGIIEDGITYGEDKEKILEILDEIYETFIISAVLKGVIEIPKFWEQKEVYFKHHWVEKPKPWIDPAKEANANKIALQTGQKTFSQICAENGRDWKETIDEMADIALYANEKGVTIGGVSGFAKEKQGGNDK